MKKHLSLILGATMLLSTCTASFAAVHPFGKDDTTADTWYTIETQEPYLTGAITKFDSVLNVNSELYWNEQTFFDLKYLNINNDFVGNNDFIAFNGSYLFSNGFFIGGTVSYEKNRDVSEGNTFWDISPGYRFNFEQGYAAASIDVGKTEYTNDEVKFLGVDFDGQYLFDNAKIDGQLYIPNEGDTSIDLHGRLKLIEELTLGLDLMIAGDYSNILIGATYIPMPELIFDAQLGDNITAFSGMYYIENFGVGMEYRKNDILHYNIFKNNKFSDFSQIVNFVDSDISQIYLKGKYNIGDAGKLVLKYGLENDDVSSIIILGYEQAL